MEHAALHDAACDYFIHYILGRVTNSSWEHAALHDTSCEQHMGTETTVTYEHFCHGEPESATSRSPRQNFSPKNH